MKLIDLGWCLAKLNKEKEMDSLIIVSPADEQMNSFVPATSVAIYGATELKKLRDTLNEEYPE